MGTLVIGAGDGFKSFLTGSVPNLKLDGFGAQFEGSDFEIDSDGWKEALIKDVV
jgi:hypothetical protein